VDRLLISWHADIDWEEYVNALREEKLRSLGVLGDNEPLKTGSVGGRGETPMVCLTNLLLLFKC
jgi:hypothetical protein